MGSRWVGRCISKNCSHTKEVLEDARIMMEEWSGNSTVQI